MQSSNTESDWKLKIHFEKTSLEMQSLSEILVLPQGTLQSQERKQEAYQKATTKNRDNRVQTFLMARKTEFRI